MPSCTQYHYPLVTFKNEEKYLLNPILKKGYKNLPEERVRMQLVEYLMLEAGFSKSRVSFESPVHLPRDKSNSRTDLICYDNDFKPLLLVECKAPEVTLDKEAALQIGRYNFKVGAPFLLVTNGVSDYWFDSENKQVNILHQVLKAFHPNLEPERNFDYWSKRGFAGSKSADEIRDWITESCDFLYGEGSAAPKFLTFGSSDSQLALDNYYHIIAIDENNRIAIALTATPAGDTLLNCVLNRNGDNIALLTSDLKHIAKSDRSTCTIQSISGSEEYNLSEQCSFSFDVKLKEHIPSIIKLMLSSISE